MSEYTAASIRVLPDADVIERQPWVLAGELSSRYCVPVEWVRRGIEACERAGVLESYFIGRYLHRDASIPLNQLVDEAMRELAREERDARTGRSQK